VHWVEAAAHLHEQHLPYALVTVIDVRGHAPREAGAKMVVGAEGSWGSIGGGNMEISAMERARAMLAAGERAPAVMEFGLTEHASSEHGRQCCGGRVQVLLEPIGVRPTVVLFGLGHVGLELARIASRLDVTLHLVDSRPEILTAAQRADLQAGAAGVRIHHPAAPESVLTTAGLVPDSAHLLVLTHDHAEDIAICDTALRRPLASIGLIGSRAKWARFRKRLHEAGHDDAALERIVCPIGVGDIAGKHPAVIAVSAAADLLRVLQKSEPGWLA
jgi:xanthine dehydrogenase accessory factor